MTRRILFPVLCLAIVALSYLLRTAGSTHYVFTADEGIDLSIVWHMEYRQHRPLVGPILSKQNFYTPPTYYYLTWLFYHVNPTPEGVRAGYLAIDMVALILFMALCAALGGRVACLLGGLMYGTTYILVTHGRGFWNPFPIQLFLIAYFLSLWYAFRKRSPGLLWLGNIFYGIALSIYPAPAILIFYVCYENALWYRRIGKYSIIRAAALSILTVFLTMLPVLIPQIMFFLLYNLPTEQIILSVSSIQFFQQDPLRFILSHLIWIPNMLLLGYSYVPEVYAYGMALIFTSGMVTLWKLNRDRIHLRHAEPDLTFAEFFPPWAFFLGLIVIIIVPDFAPQRLWGFIPLLLLASSILLAHALRSKRPQKLVALVLLALALIINLSVYVWTIPTIGEDIRITKSLADTVLADMERRGISQYDVTLSYTLPDHSPNYQLYRILYWLIDSRKFVIPVTQIGNQLDYDIYIPSPPKRVMYLFCGGFRNQDIQALCVRPFQMKYREYRIASSSGIGTVSLFVLEKPLR